MQNQNKVRCMRCKDYTPTRDAHVAKIQTPRGLRYQLKGKCSICGANKVKFVSAQQGNGLLGKLMGLPNQKVPILGDLPLVGPLLF